MEQLKIVQPTADDLGDAFGISQQRRDAISYGLDGMVNKAIGGEGRLVYAVDILSHIHSLCKTQEEYTWAIFIHLMYMARTGRLFSSPELQKIAELKYGAPQHFNP